MNLEKLIKKYGGKWVALSKDSSRVLVSSNRAKDVYEKAVKKGHKIPKLFKVPEKHINYIG